MVVTMVKFICVLHKKPGSHYDVDYVQRLFEGFKKYSGLPEDNFHCLSNVQNVPNWIPLRYPNEWEGWWSKMELFRPDLFDTITHDIFYVDLDTIITGDISQIIKKCSEIPNPVMLKDFYFRHRLASGVMYLPASCRGSIWEKWVANPRQIAEDCGTYGDQKFIGDQLSLNTERKPLMFQNIFPEEWFISYKAHVKKGLNNGDERILCYHGRPRPRETGWSTK